MIGSLKFSPNRLSMSNSNQESKSRDFILESLIDALLAGSDLTDGQFAGGITVMLHGMTITGKVISYKEWAQSYQITDSIDEIISRLGNVEGNGPIAENLIAPKRFLHLKNARCYLPGHGFVPNQGDGTYFRCRLDSIDGFFCGAFQVTREVTP